jgi:hypothetical protein
MEEVIDSSVWMYCPACSRETRHTVRNQLTTTVPAEKDPLEAGKGERLLFIWTTLQILQCGNCGTPRFRQGWNPTPHLPGTWVWGMHAAGQPEQEPAMAGNCLPLSITALCREARLAFRSGALNSATVAMRSVIEAVCIDRRCRGENLKKKIGKLSGVLSATEIHLLQMQRVLGNSAAHQMQTPTAAELAVALDVLEHLLKTLYDLPRHAEQLKRLRAERLGGHPVYLLKAC